MVTYGPQSITVSGVITPFSSAVIRVRGLKVERRESGLSCPVYKCILLKQEIVILFTYTVYK
jgi:hypothetical protein